MCLCYRNLEIRYNEGSGGPLTWGDTLWVAKTDHMGVRSHKGSRVPSFARYSDWLRQITWGVCSIEGTPGPSIEGTPKPLTGGDPIRLCMYLLHLRFRSCEGSPFMRGPWVPSHEGTPYFLDISYREVGRGPLPWGVPCWANSGSAALGSLPVLKGYPLPEGPLPEPRGDPLPGSPLPDPRGDSLPWSPLPEPIGDPLPVGPLPEPTGICSLRGSPPKPTGHLLPGVPLLEPIVDLLPGGPLPEPTGHLLPGVPSLCQEDILCLGIPSMSQEGIHSLGIPSLSQQGIR